MEPTTTDWITACAEVFAALGTVGALWAALLALRSDKLERARTEVRGFRCWIEADKDSLGSSAMATLVLYIENATDEVLYDVQVRVDAPAILRNAEIGWSRMRFPPAPTPETMNGLSGLNVGDFRVIPGSGAEGIFTDGRGHRWHRSSSGRLQRVSPARWWAPWRLEHRLERTGPRWWALRSNWHYRWDDQGSRNVNGYPPPWWAMDIRWKRWRFTRREHPVTLPWWAWRARWRTRETICAARVRRGLCLPWWAIDSRWRHWRYWRKELRAGNRDARQQEAAWTRFLATGRREDLEAP
ncbi:hypothetical protein GCM10011519_07380 [Marmoricola endophyticus]|uniref:Uncharacterized protein n=1 Tax=Marmoricola endophyticus TaxID=2040280 RepID=A0A917BBT5_9ACTN|nr:hypothetical protein GCM10011519_07380 [Marmoricola endophyticus]